MLGMSARNVKRDGYHQNKSLRVTYETEAALDRTVANLRERRDVTFKDGRVNAQAVVNASWLMLEALDSEVLVELLRPHLGRLEAILRGDPDPGYIDSPKPGRLLGTSHVQPNRAEGRPVGGDRDDPVRIRGKRRS